MTTAENHSLDTKVAADTPADDKNTVRLHITPLTPALLKVYLAPSVLPLAKNISFHTVATFPEKGFGYVELPAMEAAKIKKKLNGATLKGSKVCIGEAKPEKGKKVLEEIEAGEEEEEPKKKRVKVKKEKTPGVLEGVVLPEGRKVKRGWTEVSTKGKREKKEKGEKDERKREKRDPKDKKEQKHSKYTKGPEVLFNAKLTPVAATEALHKSKTKKEKKDKSKTSRDAVVHEFAQNTKTPSFLKSAPIASEPKPAVEYVNGKGWVDEDGNVVEPETGKARNRRALELVDHVSAPPKEKKVVEAPEEEPKPKKSKKKATPPPESSDGESSVVSSEDEDEEEEETSDSDVDMDSEAEGEAEPEPAVAAPVAAAVAAPPQMVLTPSSPAAPKEVHPLEALFKRPKPPALDAPATSTPTKGLAPIQTTFSFFDGDADAEPGAAPATPFTQKDLEWRGQRSAAPTPDTAAIGRRFSFDWRKGSQEIDEDEEDDDIEAGKQLSNNTKANAHLPDVVEEDEDSDDSSSDDDSESDAKPKPAAAQKGKRKAKEDEEEKEESEFGKWFWENRGDNNRAWKKRRRDTLKAKRLRDNKKATGGFRVA